jgi:hypothetical protein
MIPVRLGDDGIWYLAKDEAEATLSISCAWFLPGICNAPECMAKLYAELKGEPAIILFSAEGQRVR